MEGEAGCAQTMTPFGGHGPHLRPEDYGSPRIEGELPQSSKGIRPGCAAANHDLDSFRLTAENRKEGLGPLSGVFPGCGAEAGACAVRFAAASGS